MVQPWIVCTLGVIYFHLQGKTRLSWHLDMGVSTCAGYTVKQ